MNEFLNYLMRYGVIILYGLGTLIILKSLFNSLFKEHHSNWNTLIDDFDYSPKEFYERLETELKSQGITNLRMEEVYIREGGIWSPTRIYLRVKWKKFNYDVCGCKFGKGFFISWWLLYRNSLGKLLISKIPIFGKYLARFWSPITYYKVDTASMFMSYAQDAVLKVIDDITNDKGTRALSEAERKPILNNVFKR